MKTIHSIPRQPQARAFTLIELLISITVLAILAASTLSVDDFMITRAKKASATATSKSLVTALTSYETDYARLPNTATLTGLKGTTSTDVLSDAKLMVVLMGNEPATNSKLNPRNEKYFSPKLTGTPGTKGTAPKGGLDQLNQLGDPWGNFYHVVLNSDGGGTIDNPDAGGKNPSDNSVTKHAGDPATLNIPVAAWSEGPDVAEGAGDLKHKTNDNSSVSWR